MEGDAFLSLVGINSKHEKIQSKALLSFNTFHNKNKQCH